MLPPGEIRILLCAAERAVELAESGNLREGSAVLAEGLRRARRLERMGFSWAPKLSARYELALSRLADCCTGDPPRQWRAAAPPRRAAVAVVN